jgi:hypothetical protein
MAIINKKKGKCHQERSTVDLKIAINNITGTVKNIRNNRRLCPVIGLLTMLILVNSNVVRLSL